MQDKKWEFLARPGGKSCHRFFRSTVDGRVAIADNSGVDPDHTEDGPNYIDHSRSAGIEIRDGYVIAYIPVGDKFYVGVTVKDATWLIKSGIWTGGFETDQRIDDIHELLMEIYEESRVAAVLANAQLNSRRVRIKWHPAAKEAFGQPEHHYWDVVEGVPNDHGSLWRLGEKGSSWLFGIGKEAFAHGRNFPGIIKAEIIG